MNKYGAKKTKIDGIWFDSKKEAAYYLDLKLLKKAGKIIKFEIKPKIVLQESFKMGGKTIRKVTIEPDFLVYHDGVTEFVDTKGYWTSTSRLKWKMLQYQYRNETSYKFSII